MITVYVLVVPFPAVTTIGIGFSPTARAILPNSTPKIDGELLIVNVAEASATVVDAIARPHYLFIAKVKVISHYHQVREA